MTPQWTALAGDPAALSGLALAGWLAAATGVCGIHMWRRRRRERLALAAVNEWNASARGDIRAAAAGVPAESDGDLIAPFHGGHGQRVLVVDDRKGERDAVAAALDRMGLRAVFADSPWAASVAATQAEADGEPCALILINSSMEGQVNGTPLPEWVEPATSACV
jgi:hypothetical protein